MIYLRKNTDDYRLLTKEKQTRLLLSSDISDKDELKRQVDRGNDVYIAPNPYAAEIGGVESYIWGTDQDTVENSFWTLSDEI
jgi:hypothetical protein